MICMCFVMNDDRYFILRLLKKKEESFSLCVSVTLELVYEVHNWQNKDTKIGSLYIKNNYAETKITQ